MVIKNIDLAKLSHDETAVSVFKDEVRRVLAPVLGAAEEAVEVNLSPGSVKVRCTARITGHAALTAAHRQLPEERIGAAIVSRLTKALGERLAAVSTGPLAVEDVRSGVGDGAQQQPSGSAGGVPAAAAACLLFVGVVLVAGGGASWYTSRPGDGGGGGDFQRFDEGEPGSFQVGRRQPPAGHRHGGAHGAAAAAAPAMLLEEDDDDDAALHEAMMASLQGTDHIPLDDADIDLHNLTSNNELGLGAADLDNSLAAPGHGTASSSSVLPSQVTWEQVLTDLEGVEEAVYARLFGQLCGGRSSMPKNDPQLAEFLVRHTAPDTDASAALPGGPSAPVTMEGFLMAMQDSAADGAKAMDVFFEVAGQYGGEFVPRAAMPAALGSLAEASGLAPPPGALWEQLVEASCMNAGEVSFDEWLPCCQRTLRALRVVALAGL